jgi:hypothetical protein
MVLDAIATKNGAPAEITVHADGRVEFIPKLSVQRNSIVAGAEKVAIHGQRLDVERVLSGSEILFVPSYEIAALGPRVGSIICQVN